MLLRFPEHKISLLQRIVVALKAHYQSLGVWIPCHILHGEQFIFRPGDIVTQQVVDTDPGGAWGKAGVKGQQLEMMSPVTALWG